MDFLQLSNKSVLVFGVANRKSVAYHVGRTLAECGVNVVYVVQNEERRAGAAKLLGDADVYVCDVEREDRKEQPLSFGRSGFSVSVSRRSPHDAHNPPVPEFRRVSCPHSERESGLVRNLSAIADGTPVR